MRRVFLLLSAALAFAAHATEYRVDPQSYAAQVARLRQGDRLLLAPGEYDEGLKLHGLHGTSSAPIVIESVDATKPAVLIGRAGRNTVSLLDASHIIVRNLVLDGRDLPVDAVKAEHGRALVHHIVLENLIIVRHGVDQQIIGISTKAPAAFWTIRRNLIVGAGNGLYLGDSDGTRPFVAGLIEGNVVLDSLGYNMQIKQQTPRPLDRGLPVEPQRTVIKGNIFSKARNASRGSMSRPNLLLGHLPPQGPGANDTYVVEDNVFYANPSELLLHVEGNVDVERNLLLNPLGRGMAVQRYRGEGRRIRVADNFIAARYAPLSVRDMAAGSVPEIQNNRAEAWRSELPLKEWRESGHEALDAARAACARPQVREALRTEYDQGLCAALERDAFGGAS